MIDAEQRSAGGREAAELAERLSSIEGRLKRLESLIRDLQPSRPRWTGSSFGG